jgi:hypothetical protein
MTEVVLESPRAAGLPVSRASWRSFDAAAAEPSLGRGLAYAIPVSLVFWAGLAALLWAF